MANFLEFMIEKAKEIANKPEIANMTYDEAYNFVLDSLSFAPLDYEEGLKQGIYSSKEDFIEDRIKLASALCKVVAKNKIGVDPSKIGIATISNDEPKPDDMDENEWSDYKWALASWCVDSNQNEFLGFIKLSENMFSDISGLLHKNLIDTSHFARIICHELGHTKQTFNGQLLSEQDKIINAETREYLLATQSKRSGKIYRHIVHDALTAEKDADEFSVEAMHDLLKAATEKNGKTENLKKAIKSMERFQAYQSFSHKLSEKFYPIVRAKAEAFNKKNSIKNSNQNFEKN